MFENCALISDSICDDGSWSSRLSTTNAPSLFFAGVTSLFLQLSCNRQLKPCFLHTTEEEGKRTDPFREPDCRDSQGRGNAGSNLQETLGLEAGDCWEAKEGYRAKKKPNSSSDWAETPGPIFRGSSQGTARGRAGHIQALGHSWGWQFRPAGGGERNRAELTAREAEVPWGWEELR